MAIDVRCYLRCDALEDIQYPEWVKNLLSLAYVEGQLSVVLGNCCHSFPKLSYFEGGFLTRGCWVFVLDVDNLEQATLLNSTWVG